MSFFSLTYLDFIPGAATDYRGAPGENEHVLTLVPSKLPSNWVTEFADQFTEQFDGVEGLWVMDFFI